MTAAVPWFSLIVAGLPLWRPGFVPGLVRVGFCSGQSDTRTSFAPSSSVFSCQYHSTLHSHVSSGDDQYSCWWPQFRDIVSPHRHEQHTTVRSKCDWRIILKWKLMEHDDMSWIEFIWLRIWSSGGLFFHRRQEVP
jgi:hypothetical protein